MSEVYHSQFGQGSIVETNGSIIKVKFFNDGVVREVPSNSVSTVVND